MRMSRLEKDKQYLLEMLFYIDEALGVVPKVNQYGIPLDDDMVIASLAMFIGHVGEQLASDKLSEELKEQYPDIPWANIKGFRNIAFHAYSKINGVEVIRILSNELPRLKDELEVILIQVNKELSEF